jgi:hypothetical protein
MKTFFKKIALTFFIVINIFSLTAMPAYADMTEVMLGDPIALLDEIMGELGMDKGETQNTMKTINVARRKKNPPTIALTFDPANPVPGEKVTVTAMPTYFMNTTEDIYFTWYLKNKRCLDEKDGQSAYDAFKKTADFDKCNLDGDNEVDINDYKIKAMRLLVNNDFVWDEDPTLYDSDADDDGYQAINGGDDQKNKPYYCFVHDTETGDEHELEECGHLFVDPPGNDETGDNSFGKSEEEFWHTNPKDNDTADTGNSDEANACGLGQNVFTFTYTADDKLGVVAEGVSIEPTQHEDSSYKTMWAFTNNKCELSSTNNSNTGYPKTTTTGPTTHANTTATGGSASVLPTLSPATDYTTIVTVTTVEEIVPGTQVNDNAEIRTKTTTKTEVTYVGTDPDLLLTNPVLNVTTLFSTCPSNIATLDGYTCVGLDVLSDPNNPLTMTAMDMDDLNDCLYDNFTTPSEGGGATEKLEVSLKYLPENPTNDPSESGNGDTLSFTASAPNATNIDYLNYDWEVYANDEPNPDEWGDKFTKEELKNSTQTSGLGLDTFKFDLNFPQPKRYLKVKVTVKDTLTEGGAEREGHTDVVVPIFSSEESIKVYTAYALYTQEGTEEPYTYNSIVTLSSETPLPERCLFTDPETEKQTPKAICEVAQNELIALEVENEDDKYSDFLWTIDGKTNICPDETFYKCLDESGKATARTYFPILKAAGSQYTLELSMLNTATGERLSLSRVFNVMTPEVKIVPEEKDPDGSGEYTCRGLLLGEYLDFNGISYPDRSETQFQARTNYNIELHPSFSATEGVKVFDEENKCPYQWTVDEKTITPENASSYGFDMDLNNYGNLILPPKNNGEKYVISFSTVFTPTNATRQLLNTHWDVTYDEFYEKTLSHNIEIEMVDTEIAQKETAPKKVFATISSGIPGYFAFLFRIALAGTAIIFALKIIFFILPKSNFNEN